MNIPSPDYDGATDEKRAPRLTLDEFGVDKLFAAIAHVQAWKANSPPYRDEAFLEWLARDATEHPHPDDLWPEALIVQVAERIETRLWAERLPVRRVDTSLDEPYPRVDASTLRVNERNGPGGVAPCSELSIAAGSGRELWEEDAEEGVAIPADVPRGRYLALRVSGDSMCPLMHDGDMVLVKLGPEVSVDTVIVARRPDDGYVVKGVSEVTSTGIELRSVNPAYPRLTIPQMEGAVLGTVILRWCSHQR